MGPLLLARLGRPGRSAGASRAVTPPDQPDFSRRARSRHLLLAHRVVFVLSAWLALAGLAIAHAPRGGISRDPAFRLGTAGSSLRWSTALGDFDNDGRPDVAIADRVTPGVGPARYSVEVELSTAATQRFLIASRESGLNLVVADADGDGDLDIVLTPLFSDSIVALWINDGAGRFHERRIEASPAQRVHAVLGGSTARLAHDSTGLLPLSPKVLPDGCVAARRALPSTDCCTFLQLSGIRKHVRLWSSPSPARAPPVATVAA